MERRRNDYWIPRHPGGTLARILLCTASCLVLVLPGCFGRSKEADRDPTAGEPAETTLIARWIEDDPDIAGSEITAEIFVDRTLARTFPLSTFYELSAWPDDDLEVVAYGCLTLGEALLMPDELNLLLILENRTLNRHNVQSLAEIAVRLADPEGAATMNVVSKVTHRDPRTDKISSVVLETWSYMSGMRKRWTFGVRFGRFYSLEEKLVGYRSSLRELDEDFERTRDGPTTGDERYTAFWRSPETRQRMREIRQRWLEERHDLEGR